MKLINKQSKQHYILLVILFLSATSISKAQVDPAAHFKLGIHSIKIAKNTYKTNYNSGKISNNKTDIFKLRQTVKSELVRANKKLDKDNDINESLRDDSKKYHDYIKKEHDDEKTINLYIMSTSMLKNIRNTYKKIRKVRKSLSSYIENTNPEIITKQQKKMVMTGMNSIVDEAIVVYEQYDLLKLDNQMKMNDSERLLALKQLNSELAHLQQLAFYWKNRSIQSMELSLQRFQQGQSMEYLLGK